MRKFWFATVHGAYAGHGETYLDPKDVLWWATGGQLHGDSPKRIAFLRHISKQGPAAGIDPIPNQKYPAAGREGEFYLFYLDDHQPARFEFELAGGPYHADIIDPWEMTITRAPGTYAGKFMLALPAKPYEALRFTRVR